MDQPGEAKRPYSGTRTYVAVVDRSSRRAARVVDALRILGFTVESVRSVDALRNKTDLIVLSQGKHTRVQGCSRVVRTGCPVIVLREGGEMDEGVQALQFGADDYLVWPFSPRELAARIRAVLRGRQASRRALRIGFDFAGCELDVLARELRVPSGASLTLSNRECALLAALASSANLTVPSARLSQNGGARVLVCRLRRRLAREGLQPSIISSVRGVGYRLCADAKPL